MRAHLLQFDLCWEDAAASRDRAEAWIARAKPAPGDLVVLPEMFDTGFSMRTERTRDDGSTLDWMRRVAVSVGAWVVGGRTVREPGWAKARNRCTVVDPEGELAAEYDKMHPFGFGKEPGAIEAGNAPAVFTWAVSDDPVRVGLSICYDLRFPELYRSLVLGHGAEVLVVIANWPSARREHWRTLTIARAIENQAFVLAVNRSGRDPHLAYGGGSLAVGPRGEIEGELGEGEGVLSVAIDPERCRAWRTEFPALTDARPGAFAAGPRRD